MSRYDSKYAGTDFYWGLRPAKDAYRVLQLMPPDRPLTLLDIGCGEGRNAIFFARNGYQVTAFDLSPQGVEKTVTLAEDVGVEVECFVANLLDYRLSQSFDIIFAAGVLQYIPPPLRAEIIDNYREHTTPNGVNILQVFVKKPFIAPAPDAEDSSHVWKSGELFTHYHDWRLDYCTEEVFDDDSSGVPHQHAINRMVAKKVT